MKKTKKTKKTKIKTLMIAGMVISILSACQNQEEVATEIAACTSNAPSDTSAGLELCKLTGAVKHVKITGIRTSGNHGSAHIVVGYDNWPGSGQNITTGAGQARILWYNGASPAPPASLTVEINEVSKTIPNTGFTTQDQTICFDILSGPALRYWVNGVNSVDCANASTLTVGNAVATVTDFTGASADLASNGKIWFYKSASITGTPSIELSNRNKTQ